MNTVALGAAISLLMTASGLLAYDRLIAQPSRAIGVVDVAEVYRQKEKQVAELITASTSESDRQNAMAAAAAFAQRLPLAIDELPQACGCTVMLRSAVAGRPVGARDMTPVLKAKMESP